MSEYWKSNAKFWCRFCKIYITDNKSSRNIHDSGIKHKENVERFLRDQNQRSRDKETETERLNKELEAIERAALKGFQQDIESGHAQPLKSYTRTNTTTITDTPDYFVPGIPIPSTSTSEPSTEAKAEAEGSDQAESEGNSKTAESKEKIVRSEKVGYPGEWQVVEAPVSKVPRGEKGKSKKDDETNENGKHYVEGADDDEGADPEDLREFKIVEKTYPIETPINEEDGKADSGEPVIFKKRKTDAGKSRNIRRKV